jgi:IS30 family transposase
LPKSTDVASLDEHDLIRIGEAANNTPRKCLGYRTPREVFEEHLHGSSDDDTLAA